MSTERTDTPELPSDAPDPHRPSLPYEPPGVAWEEPFQVTIAASCALFPLDGSCTPKPTT
jgi:hypothetical protein